CCLGVSRCSRSPQEGASHRPYPPPSPTRRSSDLVHDLSATDVATNRVDITDPQPPAPDGSFTVVGGTNDTMPPSVVSFGSSPKTDRHGARLTSTQQITAPASGVTQTSMCVRTPSG